MASERPQNQPTATRQRAIAVQLGQLEEVVSGVADDVRALASIVKEGLQQLDRRMNDLENVRVRALEDWRLSQRVLETERSQVAAEQQHRQVSRRDLWLAVAAMVLLSAATLAGGLLAAHMI